MKAKWLFLNIFIFFIFSSCTSQNPFYGVDEEDTKGPTINVTYPSTDTTINGSFTIIGTAKDNGGNQVLKIEVLPEGSSSWTSYKLASGTTNWSITIDSLTTWGGGVSTRSIRIKASDTNYKANTSEITVSYTIDNSNPSSLGSIDDANDTNLDLFRNSTEPGPGTIDYQWDNIGTGANDYVIALYENGTQIGSSETFTNGTSGTRVFGTITASYNFPVSGTNSFRFTNTTAGNYYYIVSSPRDNSANEIKTEYSDIITIDATDPNTGGATVTDPGTFSSSTSSLFTWSGFSDANSGIDYYEVASSDDGTNWSTAQNLGQVTSVTTSGYGTETFDDGETVYLRVRAVDKAGNYSAWVQSNGLTINLSVSNVGAISDNGGADDDRDNADGTQVVQYSWTDLGDASGYIIQVYEMTVGVSDDYQALKNAGGLANGSNTGITAVNLSTAAGTTTFQFTATDGKKYYIKVKAYDDAGNESANWASSTTITVDITNPITGTVIDTTSGSIYPGDFVNSTSVNFSWSGFSDAGIGIDYYEVASSDDGTNWSVEQNLALATSVSTSGYGTETFDDGETVYLRVRAVDKVGNYSAWAYSDGILVDTTTPDVSGSTPTVNNIASARQGSIAWADATDVGGSGVDYYVIEITHSNAPVCYFTAQVDAARTVVTNLTEYYTSSVVNDASVVLDASAPAQLEYIWDVTGATADFTTVLIRVYDRAGNTAQTLMSNETNVW